MFIYVHKTIMFIGLLITTKLREHDKLSNKVIIQILIRNPSIFWKLSWRALIGKSFLSIYLDYISFIEGFSWDPSDMNDHYLTLNE